MQSDGKRLLARFTAGERDAYDEVFRLYGGRVTAFARQLTGSRADAEDLTQEVFVAALAGRYRFRGMSSLFTWLCGIAVRRRRDLGRTPRVATVEYRDGDGGEPTSGGIAPEEALALRDAVAALDPLLREPFHLVVVQGLTHREAAAVLGRPVGTVKWCTAMAARRLREALRDEEADGDQGLSARSARRSDGPVGGRPEEGAGLAPAEASGEVRRVR
jgi:RNA polymerase sigma-70 factor (ECF subfamily)